MDTLGVRFPKTERFPVLFLGHGSPMNAIEENSYTKGWAELGNILPRPRAILVVSAHWLTEGTYVHGTERPRTIHDFWGFPKELYEIEYLAPGSPEGARLTENMLRDPTPKRDHEWGLDHGAWVPLMHLFPKADIPTFQVSIDATRPATFHFELGKRLALLRERGVMIVGSGNLVHNLGRIRWENDPKPHDWAEEFDQAAERLVRLREFDKLIRHDELGEAARLSVPTPEHFWPLLTVLGAVHENDKIACPTGGVALGSVSMRSFLFS